MSDRSLVLAVFNAGKGKHPDFLVHAGTSEPGGGFPSVFGVRVAGGHALALPGRLADGTARSEASS